MRNPKLNLLLRENRGRRELPKIKKELSKILNSQFSDEDFIPLEVSDQIRKNFIEYLQTQEMSIVDVFKATESELLNQEINNINSILMDEDAYLILTDSIYFGVVKVRLKKAIQSYKEIIALDGESLCLFSLDQSKGIFIDYFEDVIDGSSEFCYDLKVWGW